MTGGQIIFEGELRPAPPDVVADLRFQINYQTYRYHSMSFGRVEEVIDTLELPAFPMGVPFCHDDPAPRCDVFWGSHGCCLVRGHRGDCICECGYDEHGRRRPHGDGNVGCAPYYGPETRFYGRDAVARGLPVG